MPAEEHQEPIPTEFSRQPPTAEDEYFWEIDRQLIEERRLQSNRTRELQRTLHAEAAHWMVCAKCGGAMSEINLSGILAEKCENCQGIYFDRNEFQTFVEAISIDGLWRKIADALTKGDTHWAP